MENRRQGPGGRTRQAPVGHCFPEGGGVEDVSQNGTIGWKAESWTLIAKPGRGTWNHRKWAISGANVDPPRTRQVRDTYETGTSHVPAWGRIRPQISQRLMDAGRGWGSWPGGFGPFPAEHGCHWPSIAGNASANGSSCGAHGLQEGNWPSFRPRPLPRRRDCPMLTPSLYGGPHWAAHFSDTLLRQVQTIEVTRLIRGNLVRTRGATYVGPRPCDLTRRLQDSSARRPRDGEIPIARRLD